MCPLGLTPFRVSVVPRSGLSQALPKSFRWAFPPAPSPEQVSTDFLWAPLLALAREQVTAAASCQLRPAVWTSRQVSALDWRSAFVGARGTIRRGSQSRSQSKQQGAAQANASLLPDLGPQGPAAHDRHLPDR